MNARKWIWRFHLYAGLTVGALLALIGLTGSLLVFDDEIDRKMNGDLLRVEAGASSVPLQIIIDQVKAAYPQETVARIRLPRDAANSGGVYEVCFKAKQDARCVYIEPATARIMGERVPNDSLKQRVFLLHRKLLSGDTGEMFVGVMGVLLLLMSLSGLWLWLPRKAWSVIVRDPLRLVRNLRLKTRGNWKTFAFSLHKTVGVFALLFLCVSGATGAYMAFHDWLDPALNFITRSPARPRPPSITRQTDTTSSSARHASLDVLIDRARHIFANDAEATMINFPATPTQPLAVRFKQATELHPNGRSIVYLDPQSAIVVGVEDATRAPLSTRIANLMYPLHVGRVGGVFTRILQVFVGLVPALLFFSGLLMWRARLVAARRAERSRVARATGTVVSEQT